jgi:antitoxin ParD1/3/4
MIEVVAPCDGFPMNVSLPPELEKLVHRKVETGRYASVSEVVREALRLMEERDQMQELHRDEIRKQIAAGMASLRAGKGRDGEAFFDRIDAALEHHPTERDHPSDKDARENKG